MTADSLLIWMSARGCGSWQQFRAAVEELHLTEENAGQSPETDDAGAYGLPLYQLLRLNVQRLGHAEFFSGAQDAEWRIVPPALAIAGRGPDALGVLVGARSPALMRRLEATANGRLQASSLDGYPTQFTIRATVSDLISIAGVVGLIPQHDAPLLMLLSLPPVDDLSAYRRAEMPFGAAWTVERFSTSTLGWKAATRPEGKGCVVFSGSLSDTSAAFFISREARRRSWAHRPASTSFSDAVGGAFLNTIARHRPSRYGQAPGRHSSSNAR